jgi:reverse gyrase
MWRRNKGNCCICKHTLTDKDMDSHMCNKCLKKYLNSKEEKSIPRIDKQHKEPKQTAQ